MRSWKLWVSFFENEWGEYVSVQQLVSTIEEERFELMNKVRDEVGLVFLTSNKIEAKLQNKNK